MIKLSQLLKEILIILMEFLIANLTNFQKGNGKF